MCSVFLPGATRQCLPASTDRRLQTFPNTCMQVTPLAKQHVHTGVGTIQRTHCFALSSSSAETHVSGQLGILYEFPFSGCSCLFYAYHPCLFPGSYPRVVRQCDARFIVGHRRRRLDRKSTRLNSSHSQISYAVFCF